MEKRFAPLPSPPLRSAGPQVCMSAVPLAVEEPDQQKTAVNTACMCPDSLAQCATLVSKSPGDRLKIPRLP